MNEIVETFKIILLKVQKNTASHPKFLKALVKLYSDSEKDVYRGAFLQILRRLCFNSEKNPFLRKIMGFCGQLVAEITRKEIQNDKSEHHQFLTEVIKTVLKWTSAQSPEMRYNSSTFIVMVLQNIAVDLEIDLIEDIQSAMLERMLQDPKIPIRVKAMNALVRLQNPENDCPVIDAYIDALSCGIGCIRKEATLHIAPNHTTLHLIKERTRDVEPSVRIAAFKRCADIGPLHFKIAEKHCILFSGFHEENENVHKIFVENLLPKWLTIYNGNFLKFISALKLTADENDVEKLMELSRHLIEWFYHNHPLDDLIAALPLNDEKLIDIEKVTNDVTLYWNIFSGILRDEEGGEIDKILPELTPFVHYLDRFIKKKSSEEMDEWSHFDYEFDLINLFEIAAKYDLADEVGRRTLQSLTTDILVKNSFTSYKVYKKIVHIMQLCYTNVDFFTNDLCQIISEIREPLVEQPLSEAKQQERAVEIARLNVKINILTEQQNETVDRRDFQAAQIAFNELNICRKELEKLQQNFENVKVKVVKSDKETLCQCLDILRSMLELQVVKEMTPSLITCKDNFLMPLVTYNGQDVHWRFLKCLSLFALKDLGIAEEFGKIISIPIATYRTIQVNTSALIHSIDGTVDLISKYGLEIISNEMEETRISDNNTTNSNTTRRKLYNNDTDDTLASNARKPSLTFSNIMEIFLDMLDDERDEIRCKAAIGITVFIKKSFPANATVISRIILKWHNPLTEKTDPGLQIRLGYLIDLLTKLQNWRIIIKDAVIPTLSAILNAPKTNPLGEMDMDNLMKFLGQIISLNEQQDNLRIFALDICMKISENVNSRLASLLVKFLQYLDIKCENCMALDELINRSEILIEKISNKLLIKKMEKLIFKLKMMKAAANKPVDGLEDETIVNGDNTKNISHPILMECDENQENNHKLEKSVQIKRRKKRVSKNCIVLLERLSLRTQENNDQLVPIIEEMNTEQYKDDNMEIETPTTDSNTSRNSMSSAIVINETSDSDITSENGPQRPTRCRKKRIL